jgi:mono/diheme cytochrome c family protein
VLQALLPSQYFFNIQPTSETMKNKFLGAVVIGAALCFANCQQPATPAPEAAKPSETPEKRGEYLVSVLGCDDCHTPKNMGPQGPAPDMSRRFMGHPADDPFKADDTMKKLVGEQFVAVFSPGMTAAVGPWGTSFAANLTPDDTGLGPWTEAQFIKALREGKSKGLDGTRPIMPPMPIPSYKHLSEDDLKAMYAYLRSVKPIKNVVPNIQLAPPPPAG